LFSGTGAVGLEALSLGARYVDFVDGDRISIGLVKKNLETFGWKDRAGVHQSDATRNLGWLRRTYSVIFMGPPYKDREKRMLALSGLTLRAIVDGRLATPDTWIICQHHAKEPIAIPEELEQFREEKYGDTLVTFYRLKRQEQ
jgi:16S rRNA G966 N2-methylase RsmD